ncbi:ACP S-malonyltransferase [Gallaecimonas xiamenensis]|uniref:Malonyl CoA-acyl carrier protein transacylase n=1 Tax=Gallaecimonas xiamenensis 3-C-1 TaxID=745411 RepID=K2K474_9GAMM|nr:ACP S-malonyltransferase [Gallaecimonas xiamenensis]EKE72210.1 malonyl CoA-acyl carrier protein transacylase [Gallaecimonas xiamenensis 3-C-1]
MQKTAFIFPGQGSQSVGMLAELAGAYPVVLETFKEASEVLGYDLWALVQNGPEADLNATERTQPALLTASVATYRAYLAQGGVAPALMAGHSLGEYSALVCAGALDFKDAVALVEARGQYMQAAVPAGTGAMAAIIGLDDADVVAGCAEAAQGDVVEAVNFNSPGQVVIAGSKAAVDRACEVLKEKGAKRALPLSVSVPSHCALMKPAAEQLAERLKQVTIAAPAVPVINNVDVASVSEGDAIRDALVRQLYSPVRWTESVQAMAQQGVTDLYECGPGKVLCGLAKRIDKSLNAGPLHSSDELQSVAK